MGQPRRDPSLGRFHVSPGDSSCPGVWASVTQWQQGLKERLLIRTASDHPELRVLQPGHRAAPRWTRTATRAVPGPQAMEPRASSSFVPSPGLCPPTGPARSSARLAEAAWLWSQAARGGAADDLVLLLPHTAAFWSLSSWGPVGIDASCLPSPSPPCWPVFPRGQRELAIHVLGLLCSDLTLSRTGSGNKGPQGKVSFLDKAWHS